MLSKAQKITSAYSLIFYPNPASEKASLAPANSVFLPCLGTKSRRKIGKLFLKPYLILCILDKNTEKATDSQYKNRAQNFNS
jgi:hypothetical protein